MPPKYHFPKELLMRSLHGCLIYSVRADHAAELRGNPPGNGRDGTDGFEHDVYLPVLNRAKDGKPDQDKPYEMHSIGRYLNFGDALCAAAAAGSPMAGPKATDPVLDSRTDEIAGGVRVETAPSAIAEPDTDSTEH